MAAHVVAVDIGGTKTVAAVTAADARVVNSVTASTPGAEGADAVIANVVALVRSLGGAPMLGIGVGTAGVVDTTTGAIISATDTLSGWAGTQLAARLRTGLQDLLVPEPVIRVQNDVDAHAWGEYRYGAAAGASSALVVAVGTGIGAGMIVDGRPWRGAHHVAGEIAHIPTPGAEGLRCPCGREGHLEALGSGLGIQRRYQALGGTGAGSARDIATRAASGDAVSRQAITDAAAAVGRGLAGAATLMDPGLIVVTGGVPDIGEAWWQPMRAAYRAEAIDALAEVPIVPGALGGLAPLRGAAAAVWDRIGDNS